MLLAGTAVVGSINGAGVTLSFPEFGWIRNSLVHTTVEHSMQYRQYTVYKLDSIHVENKTQIFHFNWFKCRDWGRSSEFSLTWVVTYSRDLTCLIVITVTWDLLKTWSLRLVTFLWVAHVRLTPGSDAVRSMAWVSHWMRDSCVPCFCLHRNMWTVLQSLSLSRKLKLSIFTGSVNFEHVVFWRSIKFFR